MSLLICAALTFAAVVLPVGTAAASSTPATGSLYFAKETAKLVGETALVPVQCVGAKGSTCNGQLSLKVGATTSEAPFSVTAGGHRIVSIPIAGALAGSSVVATAQTAQSYGGSTTATEVLHLR